MTTLATALRAELAALPPFPVTWETEIELDTLNAGDDVIRTTLRAFVHDNTAPEVEAITPDEIAELFDALYLGDEIALGAFVVRRARP